MGSRRSAAVLRHGDIRPFDRGRGIRTLHITTTSIGAGELLTGVTEFDMGAAVPFHSHNCEEAVTILAGEATFETAVERHDLVVGDSTWTPPGVVHGFSNRGPGPMRIFWTYGSVDATRTIAATGKTFPIGSEQERAGERRLNRTDIMGG